MENRLTVSTLACPDWSLETIIDACARLGIAGIDLRGIGPTLDHTLLPSFEEHALQTRAMFETRGIAIPCMCSSVRLMIRDEREWQAALVEYRRYLSVGDVFGSGFIRIFPGATPSDMTRDEAMTLARVHARELADIAASSSRAVPILETPRRLGRRERGRETVG